MQKAGMIKSDLTDTGTFAFPHSPPPGNVEKNFKASLYVRNSQATFKVATLSHFIHREPVVSLLHPQSVPSVTLQKSQMSQMRFKRIYLWTFKIPKIFNST